MENEIQQVIAEYRSIQLAKSYLSRLQKQLAAEEEKIKSLNRLLNRSEEKMEEKEMPSLKSLVERFSGTYEEQMEMQRQRHWNLILKYKDSEKFIENARFEIQVLEEKLRKESSVTQRLNTLIAERSVRLESLAPQLVATIQTLTEQVDHKTGLKKEVQEVIEVGNQLIQQLDVAATHLQSKIASHSLKGEYLNSFIGMPLTEIERVQAIAVNIKQLLLRFQHEVEDVYDYLNLKEVVNMEGGIRFTDDYYDKLITDYVLELQLDNSLAHLMATKATVFRIVRSFRKDLATLNTDIINLEEKRKVLILDSIK